MIFYQLELFGMLYKHFSKVPVHVQKLQSLKGEVNGIEGYTWSLDFTAKHWDNLTIYFETPSIMDIIFLKMAEGRMGGGSGVVIDF